MLIQSNVKSVKPSDCFVTSNYKKNKNKMDLNWLTGTAAIRVGCRTLVSPLLPFLIFVDFSSKRREEKKYNEDSREETVYFSYSLKNVFLSVQPHVRRNKTATE